MHLATVSADIVTRMTQDANIPDAGPDKNISAEDKHDLPKTAPDDVGVFFKLPERRAREGFMSLLA